LNFIEVTTVNAGLELNKVKYRADEMNDESRRIIELTKKYTSITSGDSNKYLNNEFVPKINFPVIFTRFAPSVISHVGSPAKFYFGGLAINHITEIQLNRNLIVNAQIGAVIDGNLDETIHKPDSILPHVRTDIARYMQEGNEYIKNLQLDYFFSPYKNVYAKISAGIFERMYGGLGGEFLYKPFDSNFTIGAESYSVKKRDFDQKLNFLDYETNTSHINFGYHLPKSGIDFKLSYGKYLAKDIGFTFDLSRTTKSGFRSGFFFSMTNVSSEEFGEGGYDKGFYFVLPLNIFNQNHSRDSFAFKLRPLTRDGGQKLELSNKLNDVIYHSDMSSFRYKWDGFLD